MNYNYQHYENTWFWIEGYLVSLKNGGEINADELILPFSKVKDSFEQHVDLNYKITHFWVKGYLDALKNVSKIMKFKQKY